MKNTHSEMTSTPNMTLFSKSRCELRDLPGIHTNADGGIDFDWTFDERHAVESFYKTFEGYLFHPEVAPLMDKLAPPYALCRYAIGLVIGLTHNSERNPNVLADTLNKAMAALYKALSIHSTPVFIHHLIHFNVMAGRNPEATRLRQLKQEQDATWKPAQLDELFLSWLQQSFPDVPIYRRP